MASRVRVAADNPPMAEGEVVQLMADAGLSCPDLARILGLSLHAIYRWRSGARQPSTAVRWLLRYLGARGRGEPDVLAK